MPSQKLPKYIDCTPVHHTGTSHPMYHIPAVRIQSLATTKISHAIMSTVNLMGFRGEGPECRHTVQMIHLKHNHDISIAGNQGVPIGHEVEVGNNCNRQTAR